MRSLSSIDWGLLAICLGIGAMAFCVVEVFVGSPASLPLPGRVLIVFSIVLSIYYLYRHKTPATNTQGSSTLTQQQPEEKQETPQKKTQKPPTFITH
ncbi:MAG: hypothetical protein FWC74_10345 [Candidatus Bathyarchaeota archaeon]|nr:hypothetical protein [Candidatus Termitimicrobium sp.]